ncbi:MAG: hypothetical protein WAM69_12940 [Candidatus Sulfotelmatobacter sp.]
MTATILITVLLVLAVGLFVFRAIPGIRAYFEYRGKRLITCPETHIPATVTVAAAEAAIGAFLSEPTPRLKQCSHWPERQDCGQECLQQIEGDPQNCLVWNIVSKWYEGKKCVYCRKTFSKLKHLDHPPALLSPDHKTVEWRELRPEQLPEIFSTHSPVCWNCHVAQTFRRLYPERVVNREPEPKRRQ